jgi:type I restriction enzyme M protein
MPCCATSSSTSPRLELTVANLPEDELGNGYEYLIKKFADDSGHTAAEFYTNRTVVHLMTELLDPQPGESRLRPHLRLRRHAALRHRPPAESGKEWRNVKLYGQERNLMTSSIARMNCFLHGIEDFRIVRGDTLAEPKLVEGDRLQRFDVVLANPPYSIKQWDREKPGQRPLGAQPLRHAAAGPRRLRLLQQHILASMDPKTGRCAILFPTACSSAGGGRDAPQAGRGRPGRVRLGLGPNLFYNSPMEACVVVCRTQKPKARRGQDPLHQRRERRADIASIIE